MDKMDKMDIGFIGLGSMGGAMALNALKAGHTVRVWNRSPDATKALRTQHPQLAQAEVFNLYEYVMKDDQPVEIDVFKNYIGHPDYQKTRMDMLALLTSTPKPIYSTAVPAH